MSEDDRSAAAPGVRMAPVVRLARSCLAGAASSGACPARSRSAYALAGPL